ncbi:MAG: hypothetical protein ACK4YO_02880 [Candidatus Altarchaeaceae archaeon]
MQKISSLSVGNSEFSIIANVLEIKDNGKILKAKICDDSAIVYLLALDKEKEKANFKLNDTIKITNGLITDYPPSIIVTKDTEIEILKEKIKECEKVKFIDEIPNYGYCYVDAFIVRIFDIYKFYCKRCKRYSTKICSCGNISDKILIISGMISDSTKTISFETENEEISKKMLNVQKLTKISEEQKREIIKNLFKRKYKFFGYLHNDKFFISNFEI